MYEDQRGIVLLAVTEQDLESAVTLAYTIKMNNPNENIALISNFKPEVDVFDTVVPFPFKMDVEQAKFQLWQIYWASPFVYSIFMENDTFVNTNLNQMFDYLIDHHELALLNQTHDYRLTQVNTVTDIYVKNKINKCNSNFIYFVKDKEQSMAFFKMLDVYTKHYQLMYEQFLRKEDYSDIMDIELIVSMAISHLDYYDDVIPLHSLVNIIDMNYIPFNPAEEPWDKVINFWISKSGTMKIQNYSFSGILRYRDPDFVTDEMFDTLGNIYAERSK